MEWRFVRMRRGDLNVDPVEDEFFATEFLGGITDALVREAIQNSLDAAVDERIRVRFFLGTAGDPVRRYFLGGLWPHLRAASTEGANLPEENASLRFLAVEDEGTRGLEGDPSQYEDDARDARNDFYYFWRNIGRSRKESTDRGRWGLGKTVFARASRLNAFFGLTVRHSDHSPLLMGQAVLRIHRIGADRYHPYGHFARFEDDFPMPSTEPRLCEAFVRSFGLRRRGGGLSIVVPYPDEEIKVNEIVEAVLRHYFSPLLMGRLEVEITEGNSSIVLHERGLEGEIRRREKELAHLLPLIELARWGMNPEGGGMATLPPPRS
ncbi:MAG: hypothetical protein D6795_03780, partial [Deltaproteobacteria bacterium]